MSINPHEDTELYVSSSSTKHSTASRIPLAMMLCGNTGSFRRANLPHHHPRLHPHPHSMISSMTSHHLSCKNSAKMHQTTKRSVWYLHIANSVLLSNGKRIKRDGLEGCIR